MIRFDHTLDFLSLVWRGRCENAVILSLDLRNTPMPDTLIARRDSF